jgi:hypothetical protein
MTDQPGYENVVSSRASSAPMPVQARQSTNRWKLPDLSGIDGIFDPRRKNHWGT